MKRECPGCYKVLVIPLWTSFLVCSAFSAIGHAQGAPPITASGLNTQVSAPVNLQGGAVQHNITGGTRPGGGANLFHSFGEFGVPTNNIANFLNDSGLPTNNILSRVTGGNPSNILGTIQTEGFGNANLFLMNPAGILFGPDASLNVGGATHFTTADYLRLSDGVQFTALPGPQDALLSVAPVAAFGFLESNPAFISVDGSTLAVEEGQTLSLVGGDITIGSGLNAPGGSIHLASVASPGEILTGTLAQAPNINGQSFSNLGTIQVSEQSVLDASGEGGGTVLIRGGQFVLDNSTISANVTGPGPIINGVESIGGGIDIQVSQKSEILTGSLLQTNVSGNATPDVTYGGTHIKADRIEIIGDFGFDFQNGPFTVLESKVASGSTGGNSGPITLEANSTYLQDFVDLVTTTEGTGNGGDIIFRSNGNLELNGSFLEASSSGPGNAGNIEFSSAHGNILMTNAPFITSQNFGDGAVGHISVTAPEGGVRLSNVENFNGQLFTSIQGSTGIPGTGGIQITARDLTIENSGIQIDNFTPAQPGDLNVNLTGTLTLIGPDLNTQLLTTTRREARSATLNITAHDVLLTGERSLVATETFRDGDGGALNIFTQNLEVTNGAQIRSSSRFNPFPSPGAPIITPSGAGGTINIQGLASPADSIVIDGAGSGIFTDAQGTGSAGSTTLTAKQLTITSGGRIEASTSGQGSGGIITVNASGNMSISGTLEDAPIGVLSRTTGLDPDAGQGGTIKLTAGDSLFLQNGATISAESSGQGNAGDIQATAANTILLDGASITTEAAQASGGNIKLTAEDLISLNDSLIASSVQGDEATEGGDINLDPDFIILQNSQILAKAVAGRGGNITLIANDAVLVDSFSTLDASSALGISGAVNIQAPTKFLSGAIVPLENQPVNVATLYGARCVAGAGGHFSTFVDSKTDSLSPTPGTFLASPLLLPSAQAVADTSARPRTPVILTASIAPLVLGQSSEATTACP